MKKILFIVVGIIVVVFILLIVLDSTKKDMNDLSETEKNEKFGIELTMEEQKIIEEKTFTKETLKKFNGKDGTHSYIAVNGIVYDVSNLKEWESGNHKNTATGIDLTKNFINSNHASDVLSQLKIVGKYEE